jgi:hypothetical protein
VKHQGENSSNYENAEYDALMERMRVMDNGPERQAVIDRMVDILRRDAAWSFGYFGKLFRLDHEWVANTKPNAMARNDVKYRRIDPALRELRRGEWNGPVLWPVALLLAALAVSAIPAVRIWRRRERMVARPAAGD